MSEHKIPFTVSKQGASRAGIEGRDSCEGKVRESLKAFDIDELITSPWVGLHYRHEFLLHHRHELLEQQSLH